MCTSNDNAISHRHPQTDPNFDIVTNTCQYIWVSIIEMSQRIEFSSDWGSGNTKKYKI